MTPYHICSEECFCSVLSSNLLEQLEIVPPQEEDYSLQPDPELASRYDQWWDDLEELGGEG